MRAANELHKRQDRIKKAVALSALLLASPAVAQEGNRPSPIAPFRETLLPSEPARPDPVMTPGAVDPSVTLADICNGTAKHRRHVSPTTRAKVMRDYNMPAVTTQDMELDHLVPLALAGSNAAANLWPQPGPDYERKDRLEVEMQRRACVAYRTLAPAEAAEVLAQEQREIAEDWVAAEKKMGRTH